MAAGFRTLADEKVGTEIESNTGALRIDNLDPELGLGSLPLALLVQPVDFAGIDVIAGPGPNYAYLNEKETPGTVVPELVRRARSARATAVE